MICDLWLILEFWQVTCCVGSKKSHWKTIDVLVFCWWIRFFVVVIFLFTQVFRFFASLISKQFHDFKSNQLRQSVSALFCNVSFPPSYILICGCVGNSFRPYTLLINKHIIIQGMLVLSTLIQVDVQCSIEGMWCESCNGIIWWWMGAWSDPCPQH